MIDNAKDIVWIKCGDARITFGNESSVARTRCNRDADICGFNADADFSRTGLDADGHCSDTDMDWMRTRMRTVFGLDAVADWTRSRIGHGLTVTADIGAAICPDRLRFLRVHCADGKTLSRQGVRLVPSKTDR